MSKKRYVDDNFWTDPYVEQLDPIEKLAFLYLLTNSLCNLAGIYEITMKRLAYDLSLDVTMANIILERFVRDSKLLRVDNWVIILNFGKHQNLNPNMKEGARRILESLPQKVKALEGFERVSYLTLLNFTLPYSTLPKSAAAPLATIAKKGGEGASPNWKLNENPKAKK